jgi:ectoine hydroxylase
VVYPSPGGPLSAAQVRRYEVDGFLVLAQLVDETTVAALGAEVDRLVTAPELADAEEVVREPDSDEVRSIFAVHRISPLIASLVASDTLAGVARQLLGSDVYVHQSRVNRKLGFAGREFAWHSDFETWHAEDGMPAARALSISLALTPNFVHNGSLMLIPGSHRTFVPTGGATPAGHYLTSLRQQEVGVPDRASLTTLVEQAGDIVLATGGPGSAVVFDCNAMHGSTGNMTPFPRTNIFVVYNSVENPLQDPFAAPEPRPPFVATRHVEPLVAERGAAIRHTQHTAP